MGFGQEMKDFISAAQAGQKMRGAESDLEYNELKKRYLSAQADTIEQKNADEEGQDLDKQAKRAAIRLANSRANSEAAYQANLNRPVPDPNAGLYATQPQQPQQPQPVVGPAVGGAPPPQQPGVPTMASGGPVKKYAEGGAVTPDDDGDDDEETTATPAVGGASGDTDFSSRNRGFSGAAAQDAVQAGLSYGNRTHGFDQTGAVATPGSRRAAQSWASGAHAAPAVDMEKVKDAVDPKHQMGESERNLAAIGAVYQFKMNKGDTQGAAQAAFQMIQHYRQASQRYAVLSAAAAQKGDLDVATHAAMKAYANVPDGKDFHVEKTPDGKLSYSFTDSSTGKVISQGIETPDKLAASAMGFAQQGFDQALYATAGQQAPKPAKVVDPNAPLKIGDRTKAIGQVNDAYTAQNPIVPRADKNDATQESKYGVDSDRDLKGAAFRVYSHGNNGHLTPDEAVSTVTKIADPTLTDAKTGFSPKKVDGGYEISIGKRTPTFIPEGDFDTLMEKRSAALDAIKSKKDKADEDSKKPGFLADTGISDGLNKVGAAIGSYLDKNKAKAEAEIAARNAAPPAATDYSQPQP